MDHAPPTAAQRGLCTACNYPLRGLHDHRCPECGRPFDPADPRTMNMGRPLSPASRWLLTPTGWPLLILTLISLAPPRPACRSSCPARSYRPRARPRAARQPHPPPLPLPLPRGRSAFRAAPQPRPTPHQRHGRRRTRHPPPPRLSHSDRWPYHGRRHGLRRLRPAHPHRPAPPGPAPPSRPPVSRRHPQPAPAHDAPRPNHRAAPGGRPRDPGAEIATKAAEYDGDEVLPFFKRLLTERGLSEAEAQSLLAAWAPELFTRNGVRLLVLLSADDYDSLCPIRIRPAPSALHRIGIVVTE